LLICRNDVRLQLSLIAQNKHLLCEINLRIYLEYVHFEHCASRFFASRKSNLILERFSFQALKILIKRIPKMRMRGKQTSVTVTFKKQDTKKQGLRPRKRSKFFTKLNECFSGHFNLISSLAGALKCPHKYGSKVVGSEESLPNS